jgi:glycerol uptake facilitator-like aquaporin
MIKDQMIQPLLAEFVGVSMIMLGFHYVASLPVSLAIYVLAKALTLGHLNPLVTLWYFMKNKLSMLNATYYIIAQILAVVMIAKTDF